MPISAFQPNQLKMPVEVEQIIEVDDPVYSFNKSNHYGRTEELCQCEDCSGCPHKEKCSRSKGNRTIRLNEKLTRFHEQVFANLNCIHGALLRMNRSIQAEGAFDSIKLI